MTLLKKFSEPVVALDTKEIFPDSSTWESINTPGLTPAFREIHKLAEQLPKELAVFAYKQKKKYLWVVFMGGTGTGKSTLYNALCGRTLSETGVERPKTYGPIVYADQDIRVERDFPFPSIQIKRLPVDDDTPHAIYAGVPGEFLVLEHGREEISHFAFVDTPDLDSLELHNREMAEDLYLLADVVVFVTSQEKYADEVPFQFLKRIHEEGKTCFLLLNKADPSFSCEEVLSAFRVQGLRLNEKRLWLLPYAPSEPIVALRAHPEFQDFLSSFYGKLTKSRLPDFLHEEATAGAQELVLRLQRLMTLLDKEKIAAQHWLHQLEVIFSLAAQKLVDLQQEHFTSESRAYLQEEIRAAFSKYDVLAKPRRLVRELIATPLRLLGLSSGRPPFDRKEALLRVREKIDLSPIRAAVETLNRTVLEKLSPVDESSPLFKKLRQSSVFMTDEEIKKRVWDEQERLASWLESTFQQLAQDIPVGKKWGIYSTSVLWGALIISFEVAVGGGISIMEAVLDSAIAPFVTKGAVEVFAYHEIQKIARELADRYQEGLVAVVRDQRDRYIECIMSLMPPGERIETIRSVQEVLQTHRK